MLLLTGIIESVSELYSLISGGMRVGDWINIASIVIIGGGAIISPIILVHHQRKKSRTKLEVIHSKGEQLYNLTTPLNSPNNFVWYFYFSVYTLIPGDLCTLHRLDLCPLLMTSVVVV